MRKIIISIVFSIFLAVGGFFLIRNKFGTEKVYKRDFVVVNVRGKGFYRYPLTVDKGTTVEEAVKRFMTDNSPAPTIYKTSKGKELKPGSKIL